MKSIILPIESEKMRPIKTELSRKSSLSGIPLPWTILNRLKFDDFGKMRRQSLEANDSFFSMAKNQRNSMQRWVFRLE